MDTDTPVTERKFIQNEGQSKGNGNRRVMIFIILAFLLFTSPLVGYIFQQNNANRQQIEDLKIENKKISQKFVETQGEVELLKNPPEPSYCDDANIYQNNSYKYIICLPEGWLPSPDKIVTMTRPLM